MRIDRAVVALAGTAIQDFYGAVLSLMNPESA